MCLFTRGEKTTDGVVRGWYHILKSKTKLKQTTSVVALELPMLLQR